MRGLEEAAERIREAARRGEVVVAAVDCEVYYSGRSFSKLGRGERLLILKPDGSVIVHRPRGHTPVNYQPHGSALSVTLEGGRLHIRSARPRPLEVMDIYVYRVLHMFTSRLRDDAEFSMWGTEEDIKRAIMVEPSILGEPLRLVEEERRMGDRGFADLLLVDGSGTYVVVEVKKHSAGKEAVEQLKRYVDYYKRSLARPVRGVLVAPALARGAQRLLEAYGLEYRRLDLRRAWEVLRSREGLMRFLAPGRGGSSL